METKEIDGVLYELVPEEEEKSCKGCAFYSLNRIICNTLTDDCNKGFVYKKINKPISTSNLKPFNLEAAKAGKPVCTRNGRKARIIAFDAENNSHPIIALVKTDYIEKPYSYSEKGEYQYDGVESRHDLMMLPEKKEGYVNVYRTCDGYNVGSIYPSEEAAKKQKDIDYIATVKIEWEE